MRAGPFCCSPACMRPAIWWWRSRRSRCPPFCALHCICSLSAFQLSICAPLPSRSTSSQHTHTHHLTIVCCTSSVGAIIGLLLIACGSGGIKPCVSAFGADQFGSSEREQLSMSRFFSVFYFFMCAFDSASRLYSPPLYFTRSQLLRILYECILFSTCLLI